MNLIVINSIRTNNFTDEKHMEKISSLWKASSSELVNNESIMYGVYHDYDSNYKGDYSLSVALEWNGEASMIRIPIDQEYKVYKVNTSDTLGIVHTWGDIWREEEEGRLERAYSYDYEKYYPNGEIEIYIALK